MSLRQFLKNAWFGLRGKDPEAAVVHFWPGDSHAARAMVEEARGLIPDRRHYLVHLTADAPPPFDRVTPLSIATPSVLSSALGRTRIGIAPVLFDGNPQYAALRRAAFLAAPGRILAYNPRGERLHLKISDPIASALFLRGVPLDRVYLRPSWLFPWRRDRTTAPSGHRIVPGRGFSKARARTAVLTPYLPYPLSHGGAVRLFYLLREASVDFDIVLFAFLESPALPDPGPLAAFIAEFVYVEKPRYREPRWSTLRPPEVGEYESPAMREALASRMSHHGIKTLQTEFTQLAAYGGDILVEHDITFDLYRQVRERRPTLSTWWDWHRWRRFEQAAIARAPRLIVMSEKDARLSGHPRPTVIPNGVDLARFQPTPEPSAPRVLFIGSFRHFPNIVAFRFLLDEIWPLVRAEIPNALCTVVAGPDPLLYWRAATSERELPTVPGLDLQGFVADVSPLYSATHVVVVPTRESAGTNLKVLEAMAAGRALATTASGCAGIAVEHNRSAWIADTAEGLARGMITLLRDPDLRAALAAEARRIAEERYSWRSLGQLQRRLWADLSPPPVEIRRATESDLPSIRAILATSPEAGQWDPDPSESWVAAAPEIAAIAVFRPVGPSEIELLNLAVHPASRRQGLAQRLLASSLEHFRGEVFLEVRESNSAAQSLYRKLGFQVAGRRARYYQNPPEDGIVLRLRIC